MHAGWILMSDAIERLCSIHQRKAPQVPVKNKIMFHHDTSVDSCITTFIVIASFSAKIPLTDFRMRWNSETDFFSAARASAQPSGGTFKTDTSPAYLYSTSVDSASVAPDAESPALRERHGSQCHIARLARV